MTRQDGPAQAQDEALQHSGVDGVLFDIDDTLVDLERAMGHTLQSIPDPALSHLSDDDWVRYKALYTSDPQRHYHRFLAGEITFEEQRVHRVRHARSGFTPEPFLGAVADAWVRAYESMLPLHFRAYDDVAPLLDELEARGVPYGAVSNNVHDYQRAKLDRAGLNRIEVLVGIDTVGVAKPEPGIYLEGARLIGTAPGRTLYVGDNHLIDAIGARSAGLVGVWLDRAGGCSEPGTRSGGVGEQRSHPRQSADPAAFDTPAEADGGLHRGSADDARQVPCITGLDAVLQFLPSVR